MELQILQGLLSLGVGGALAALVLYWKRSDDKRYQILLEKLTNRSNNVIEDNTKALSGMTSAVNTFATILDISGRLEDLEKQLGRVKKE